MNDEFKMGQGLGHHLEMAFARNDWTEADVNKLGQGDLLAKVLHLVRGTGVVQITKHVVNLAGDCMPESWKQNGWKIESRVGSGMLELDPSKVGLHLSPNQQGGKVVGGNNLRKELEDDSVPILNGCVLDYFLAHPEIIREDWKVDENGKTRYIFFWGTIYRSPNGFLCVRYLCWRDGTWSWDCVWLGRDWLEQHPAAVLASVPRL